MLACFLTLLFFLPIIFVATAIENLFTSEQLAEMGIRQNLQLGLGTKRLQGWPYLIANLLADGSESISAQVTTSP